MSRAILPQVDIRREPDGATLICHARRDVPVVSVELQTPGGRAGEPDACPGLAYLATDLLDEGPADTTPEAWRRLVEGLAVDIDCAAGYDHWSARFHCLSENLAQAGALFKRLLARPGLPRGEFKRLAKARRAGERESWAQPMTVIRQMVQVQNLGFNHPLAHPPYEKDYAQACYEPAAAMAAKAFRRNGAVMATIGGDIEPEAGFALLREILDALPEGDSRVAVPTEPSVAASEATVWIADNRKGDQAFYALARPGIRAGDPDRVALRLANWLMGGGGFESRLMQRIREKAGGTYGIHSQLGEYRMASPFSIQSSTRQDRLAEMLELIKVCLAETAEQGFSEQEVREAGDNRFGELPLRLTSPQAVLGHAVQGLRAGLTTDDLDRDWHACRSTTPEQVHAAARRIVGDGRFRLAVVGPASEIRTQVREWGPSETFKASQPPNRWPSG